MAKSKVSLKLYGLEKLRQEFRTGEVYTDIGKAVVKEMREVIDIGLSPVEKVGRFVGYAYQRKAGSRPSNQLYPKSVQKDFPSKAVRPVNLSLNDKFLNTLGYKKVTGGVEIGHITFDDQTKNLFEAHNEGMNRNVPKRQYLPNKRGENFIVSIQRIIKDVVLKAVKRKL